MKKLLSYFLFLSIMYSCASPQKNLEKGNYEKAFEGALGELEDGKRDNYKSILNNAYGEMLEAHHTEYELYMRSDEVLDWESAYQKRDNLVLKYIRGKRWLRDNYKSQIDIFEQEQDSLASDIAWVYKSMGDDAMLVYKSIGDRFAAQDAFNYYSKVFNYDMDNANIQAAIDEALQAGMIHIVFEVDSWDLGHVWDIERKFKNLERESKGFYQVYVGDNFANPDCKVEIDFNKLNTLKTPATEVLDFEEKIQNGFESVRDTSGIVTQVPVYITVKGSVTITTESTEYIWEVRAKANKISDYCDFRSNNFVSRNSTKKEYYNLQGDNRAIPQSYKDKSYERVIDNEAKVIDDLIDDLYRKVLNHFF